MNIKWVL